MNKYTLPLTAILCISLLSSCADDKDIDSETLPSSSSKPSSSSSVAYVGGSCDISGYRTVKIGNQTWMAQNLNCDVAGSVCYDNDPANCAKYGRLYNWETAKDICPNGWRLPSNEDWDEFIDSVGGESTAGTKLKANDGWNDYEGKSGNGTDDFVFSALPGGGRTFDGNFIGVGSYGSWWSSQEYDASIAYLLGISYEYEDAGYNGSKKSNLLSVRCVKD